MANTLRIKRRPSSGSAGAPSSLYNGELAFNENDNILYYGYGSGIGGVATSFPSIGGSGAYTLLGGTNATGTWPIGITGNAGTVTSGVYTSRTLTAGSGLVGGGDLSANRTFDIGQGDGISVSADSIAVDSTVIRTTGTQTITGNKTFSGTSSFTAANTTGNSVGYFAVFDSDPNSTSQALKSVSKDQILDDIGAATSGLTLTAGSGLTGGGTLSTDRTFDIGQGDGISVSADSIAVDSTVVRTTGAQTINGVKTLGNTTYFNSGIISSGTNSIQAASTGSTATQFAVFTSSPNSSAQTVYTRTPSEVKTDIGLNNVTNDAQVKKIASTTIGYIPTWAVTSGDQLATGYSVETTLTGGSTAIARADAVKTYIDNLLGANDAMIFKGTIGTGGTVTALPTTYSAGWTYRVITAGTYAGIVCEIGDLIIAVINRSGSGNLNSDWTVAQTNIDGAVINTRTLTAGSGLTGGGDLSADRTFNIGAGDGITVNADDVAVDSTVVRTTGTQNISGNKNLSGTIVSSGTLSLKMATTASTATQFPVFTSDPSSTAQTVSTRTPSQVKTDIGLSNVENTALSTWAGSTNITTLGIIGTGTWSATTIAANKGGTGQSSYTIGDLLYADTSSTLAKLADVATGNVLLAGGVATAPSWGKVNLTSGTHVSGTLPVTNGGTGQTSYINGELLIGNTTGNTLSKATLTQGTGIAITNGAGSITVAHASTSSLSGSQGSNGIASITVDGLGHVTAVTTATYLTAATVCAAITDCTLDGGTF